MKRLFPKIALLDGSIFTIVIVLILLAGYFIIGDTSPLMLWLALGGGLLALGVLTYISLQRRVIEPLHQIQKGIQTFSKGDFSHRLSINTDDELEDLAEAFNEMAERLQVSQERLGEEQSKVFAALESSRDAIWVSNANQEVVMVNSALENLIGRSRSELIGLPCEHLFGMQTLNGKSICDQHCPFKYPNRAHGGIEGRFPIKGGKEAFVEISYGQVRDPDDQLSGVVHIVHDLTQRKQVEQLKDDFLSMVSHEMRTPLHHIKGFATTLLQTDVEWDLETQRDFLESINREADRLSDLVEKTLHLTRLEVEDLSMEVEWYQVHELVDTALLRRRTLLSQHPIQLNIPENLPGLYVDGREIETVIINLIENAQKYSDTDSPISVDVFQQGDEMIFCVTDQGIGILPDDQERIFERFFRGDNGQRRVSGTGLGLAICKRIVDDHEGRIWVESERGQGSRFYFSLPIKVREDVVPER